MVADGKESWSREAGSRGRRSRRWRRGRKRDSVADLCGKNLVLHGLFLCTECASRCVRIHSTKAHRVTMCGGCQ